MAKECGLPTEGGTNPGVLHCECVLCGGQVCAVMPPQKKKNQEKPDIHESEEKIRAQLPAKLLDYFLRSNKSNINQTRQSAWLDAVTTPFTKSK